MQQWTEAVLASPRKVAAPHRIGLLPGEGVGPEVTRIALRALDALDAPVEAHAYEGAAGGIDAFCEATFAAGGAVLAGPYGGRFVYDLRRRFSLFCKLSPLAPSPAFGAPSIDVLVVRENLGGVYQGSWCERTEGGERVAEHSFSYTESQVRRVLSVAARLAAHRRGSLAVVVKPGGAPTISRLWCDVAAEIADAEDVAWRPLDLDYAAYRLVRHPDDFDVIVAPNLAADVLCDVGAVHLGSRALSFGASFSADGAAVYQTNHGAAFDLAGKDRCNPAGHLLALAMLLRHSLGLLASASALETAIEAAWASGLRTDDLSEHGARGASTSEFADWVVAAIERRSALGVA